MTVTQIFGPPGCGKTTALMDILEQALQDGIHPSRIAVCSFSRKAINEFLDRAVARFEVDRKHFPHMRTLHSTAFRALGIKRDDVMSKKDYEALGAMLGEMFNVNVQPEAGMLLPWGHEKGTRYMAIIDRARYRMVDIEDEWRFHQTYEMTKAKCRQIKDQMDLYKKRLFKFDFVDMIEHYVQRIEPPALDLFILDEAQDLTPLQWEMAKKIASAAERTFTAGDDDQAIHEWSGAEAKSFVEFGDERRILTQSHRLPKKIFDLSDRIVRRIRTRVPKEYHPTEDLGEVHWHTKLSDVSLGTGSITIMARTNAIAKTLALEVHNMGYYYALSGKPPVTPEKIRALSTWRTLAAGGEVFLPQIKDLYQNVPKQGPRAVLKRGASSLLDAAAADERFTMDSLVRNYGMREDAVDRAAFDVLALGDHLSQYLRRIELMGEDITKEPRIKIGTIHSMKGGEDDICVLFTGTNRFIEETASLEGEHRVFYVGVTRAKRVLHIVQPPLYDRNHRNYRYEI